MAVAGIIDIADQVELRLAQGFRLTGPCSLQLSVEVTHQLCCSLTLDAPQAANRTTGTRLNGDTREPERGAIAPAGRLAGTQDQQVDRSAADIVHPDEVPQLPHGQL